MTQLMDFPPTSVPETGITILGPLMYVLAHWVRVTYFVSLVTNFQLIRRTWVSFMIWLWHGHLELYCSWHRTCCPPSSD